MVSGRKILFQLVFTPISMFPTVIETDQLRLEQLTEAVDPLDVYEYYANSETIAEETKYISWDPHQTLKETWDAFDTFEER